MIKLLKILGKKMKKRRWRKVEEEEGEGRKNNNEDDNNENLSYRGWIGRWLRLTVLPTLPKDHSSVPRTCIICALLQLHGMWYPLL